jgi:hypothetical protein
MQYLFFSLLTISFSLASFAAIEDHNFGVVISNKNYQIYRSSSLGKDGIKDVWKHLKSKRLPTPKTIIYMNDEGYKSRLFSDDFALQQYAMQEEYGFKMHHSYDYKQRTYLEGHNPYSPSEDIDRKNNLNGAALKLFGPDPKDGLDGGIDAFYRIMDIVLDPANQPVLFHCLGGKHRTGMVGMTLRHLQSDKAKEVVSEDPIYQSRAEVEYKEFAGALSAREANVQFVRKFIKTKEYKDYQRRYRIFLK